MDASKLKAAPVDLSALDALASDMEALRRFLALHGSERACAAFARIASALEAARADGEWLPIESAPKDGTMVLAFVPGFGMGQFTLYWMDGYWREPANGMGLKCPPTAWRPLPSPPASASKDDPNV